MHNAKPETVVAAVAGIKGPRPFWNKHMPRLACDNCAFVAQCPQYRAGHECAFLPFLHGHEIKDERDLLEYAKHLASENMRRAHQTLMMETMTGASPSVETSEQLSMAMDQLLKLHQRITDSKVKGTMTVHGPGVVAQLFGTVDDLMEHVNNARNTINGASNVYDQSRADEAALDAALSGEDFTEIGLPKTEPKALPAPVMIEVPTVSARRKKEPAYA